MRKRRKTRPPNTILVDDASNAKRAYNITPVTRERRETAGRNASDAREKERHEREKSKGLIDELSKGAQNPLSLNR